MASAFQPTPRARLRRALGLAAVLATLGLGALPAVSLAAGGVLTLPDLLEQPAPTPAPTPPGAELRPIDPAGLDLPLLPQPDADPTPTPVPLPGPELAPLLAPVPGVGELAPLLAPLTGATEDAASKLLSSVVGSRSAAATDGDPAADAAGTPQGAGSASTEPTTGATAPDAGASGPGPDAVSPAPPTPAGTVTAATLAPVIDALSRSIAPARRSREIAPSGSGRRTVAPVRVAVLEPERSVTPAGSAAPAATTRRPPPAAPDQPRVLHDSPLVGIPTAAVHGAVRAAVGVGRSPWLPIVLVLATVAYVLGQRLMDGGRKLSHAGHGDEPDDELIEL